MATARKNYIDKYRTGASLGSSSTAFTPKKVTPTPKSNFVSSIQQPSQPWKDFGATKKLSPDGSYLQTKKDTPVQSSVTPTAPTLSPAGQDFASGVQDAQAKLATINSGFADLKANQGREETQSKGTSDPAYLRYLRSLENPTEASNIQKERDTALQGLADIQSKREEADLEARRRYEEILDRSGGTRAGAVQGATQDRRRSNQELADIALQESAAGRTAQVAQGAYQSEQDRIASERGETPSGFSLGKDQIRYEYDTETGGYKQVGGGIGGGSVNGISEGEQASAVAYADLINSGRMKIENVPAEARGAVAQLTALGENTANTQISPYRAQAINRMDTTIDSIIGAVSGWTTGFGSWLDVIPGSDARNMKAELNTLKANIGFQELTAMRDASKTGGALGQVSDTEIRLLTNVLGALDTGQSPEQFKKNLQIIKGGLQPFLEELGLMEQSGGQGQEQEEEEGGLYDF